MSFQDSSISNHSFSVVGSPTIQSDGVFSQGAQFSGVDYVSYAASPDFDLTDGNGGIVDFTIEFRAKFTVLNGVDRYSLLTLNSTTTNESSSVGIGYFSDRHDVTFQFAQAQNLGFSQVLNANQWYAFAFTGKNLPGNQGIFRSFLDGILKATTTRGSLDIISTNNNNCVIAGPPVWVGLGYVPLIGRMDEVRITKGVCLYTANYSVAVSPFTS